MLQKHRDSVYKCHGTTAVHYSKLLLVSHCVFQKYISGPKGSFAKCLFFLLTTKLSICLPLDTMRSLCGRAGRTLNADYCFLHNSPGPLPGHSIVIQLFLDKPTQINIYSCLQVRGLNEPRGGWQRINCSV